MKLATIYKYSMYNIIGAVLTLLVFTSIMLSWLNLLPYTAVDIALTAFYLTLICVLGNLVMGKMLRVAVHLDSAIITALILTLIIGPVSFSSYIIPLTLVAVLAIAARFAFDWKRKHIFNPAALAAVFSAAFIGFGASWWVGSPLLLPIVAIGGFFVAYRAHRLLVSLSFLLVYFLLGFILRLLGGSTFDEALVFMYNLAIYSPLVFFAFFMVSEPLTSPDRGRSRIIYSSLIATLAIVIQSLSLVFFSLELALLGGNLFVFFALGYKNKVFKLLRVVKEAPDTRSYIFTKPHNFKFEPGQYLQWSLPGIFVDKKGNRRFMTIASAPCEKEIMMTTKLIDRKSWFKASLDNLKTKDTLCANGPYGSFTLPTNTDKQPLVWIAGGIGITPFRSMAQSILATDKSFDATLFYSAESEDDLLFRNVFDELKSRGSHIVYVISGQPDKNWSGETGYVNRAMIKRYLQGKEKRAIFYISGPPNMLTSIRKELLAMGIKKARIKTDYFEGY